MLLAIGNKKKRESCFTCQRPFIQINLLQVASLFHSGILTQSKALLFFSNNKWTNSEREFVETKFALLARRKGAEQEDREDPGADDKEFGEEW